MKPSKNFDLATISKPTWPRNLAIIFAFVFVVGQCSQIGSEKPASKATQGVLSEESKQGLAALINVHGELCAKVLTATPMGNDIYTVACTRYRDGTGQATYIVNLKTGAVK